MKSGTYRLATMLLAGLTLAACGNHSAARHASNVRTVEATHREASDLVGGVAASPPARPFAGTIELRVRRAGEPSGDTITYEISGDHLRYEEGTRRVPARRGVALVDFVRHEAYVLRPSGRSYLLFDTSDAERGDAPTGHAQLTKQPTYETLAGHRCQDWQLRTPVATYEICAASGIPFFTLAQRPESYVEPPWAAALTEESAFPLRLVSRDANGREQLRVEVVRIDEKPIGRGELELPHDYRQALTLWPRPSLPGIS
jgi:hypothetical protein